MKQVTINFDESAQQDLQRLVNEGKLIFLDTPLDVPVYEPLHKGKIDRERDIVWAKPVSIPFESMAGSITKESAEEMINRIEQGW